MSSEVPAMLLSVGFLEREIFQIILQVAFIRLIPATAASATALKRAARAPDYAAGGATRPSSATPSSPSTSPRRLIGRFWGRRLLGRLGLKGGGATALMAASWAATSFGVQRGKLLLAVHLDLLRLITTGTAAAAFRRPAATGHHAATPCWL